MGVEENLQVVMDVPIDVITTHIPTVTSTGMM